MVGFVVVEHRSTHPMLPLRIFRSRALSATNLITFVVYGALGGVFFFLVITLQVVAGFSALAAGLAPLPVTILMLLLSARSGTLAGRIGPRIPMTAGPLVCAVGATLLAGVGPDATYATDVLPGVVVLGLGLSLTVAPLTATALASADNRHAGIASGVNDAGAREPQLDADLRGTARHGRTARPADDPLELRRAPPARCRSGLSPGAQSDRGCAASICRRGSMRFCGLSPALSA